MIFWGLENHRKSNGLLRNGAGLRPLANPVASALTRNRKAKPQPTKAGWQLDGFAPRTALHYLPDPPDTPIHFLPLGSTLPALCPRLALEFCRLSPRPRVRARAANVTLSM